MARARLNPSLLTLILCNVLFFSLPSRGISSSHIVSVAISSASERYNHQLYQISRRSLHVFNSQLGDKDMINQDSKRLFRLQTRSVLKHLACILLTFQKSSAFNYNNQDIPSAYILLISQKSSAFN
ncbi:hypothetical protein BT96DRAFT_928623 [Gymnopus androsaceus JB14]|uniref:Uncharacterized protein n=1 Tax=Gymnopus androsaceus JB14 TaxID=1447944 RepID=A0A6A4GKN9_9AGAR|nr:hypothetical protein BT96DRAFT_928623 [Gymnopus androsaceus JB14]